MARVVSRITFRVLIAATLAVMAAARMSRGRLPSVVLPPFHYWFVISVFVFGIFGLFSAYHAWREPHNRRAYLTDVVLAAAWVPYWFSNLR
jgi:drug/metabolite transporter (DMT)-like permease